MSVMGQTLPIDHVRGTSALPPIATELVRRGERRKGHVWTVPALQEESDFSAKRSGAAMYPACFRVEACPVAMRPQWPLALM